MTKNIKKQKMEEPKETVAAIATESAEESTVITMIDKTIGALGTVCNCKKLNVRERPTKKAKILHILNLGEVVLIDTLETRVEGWYKVAIEDGIIGYCMEDFIKIS